MENLVGGVSSHQDGINDKCVVWAQSKNVKPTATLEYKCLDVSHASTTSVTTGAAKFTLTRLNGTASCFLFR